MKYVLRRRFNPNHVPAGSPEGGQFAGVDLDLASPAQLESLMTELRSEPDHHPNIIGLKVAGESIFHPEMALPGMTRDLMPQIPSKMRDDFLSSLSFKQVSVDPRTLGPTQTELDGYKTALFASETNKYNVTPLVSSDGYVIDGHHNWAGAVIRAVEGKDDQYVVNRVNMTRADLMTAAREYSTAHGIEAKPIHKFNPNHVPGGRPDGGQFTSISGYSEEAAMAEFDSIFGPYIQRENGHLNFREGPGALDAHEALLPEALQWMRDNPTIARDIQDYIGTDYAPLNAYLRTGEAKSKYGMVMSNGDAKSMAARMTRGMETAPVLPDGTVLYRVFRSDAVIARADAGGLTNGIFHDRAFLSTSLDTAVVRDFYEDKFNKSNAVIMRITTREGAQGILAQASLGGIASYRPGEFEVLLDKSTDLYVNKVTKLSTGAIIVDADVYGDKSKVIRFNPNHVPAGSEHGGEFASADQPDFSSVDPGFDDTISFASVFATGVGRETPEAQEMHDKLARDAMVYRGKLDRAQSDAVNDYKDSGYRPLNSYLRDGIEGSQGASDLVPFTGPDGNILPKEERARLFELYADHMSQAVQNAPAHPELTVYRAFRSDELQTVAGHLVGTNVTEPGFLSTSLSTKMVGNWFNSRLGSDNAVALRLKVPADVPALYLPDDTEWAYEYEVLLDRGTPMRVTGVTKMQEGGILIDATAMKK